MTSRSMCESGSSPRSELTFLVCWWHLKVPFIRSFTNRMDAELYAAARNGLLIETAGDVRDAHDWYYRDNDGNPKPVTVER